MNKLLPQEGVRSALGKPLLKNPILSVRYFVPSNGALSPVLPGIFM